MDENNNGPVPGIIGQDIPSEPAETALTSTPAEPQDNGKIFDSSEFTGVKPQESLSFTATGEEKTIEVEKPKGPNPFTKWQLWAALSGVILVAAIVAVFVTVTIYDGKLASAGAVARYDSLSSSIDANKKEFEEKLVEYTKVVYSDNIDTYNMTIKSAYSTNPENYLYPTDNDIHVAGNNCLKQDIYGLTDEDIAYIATRKSGSELLSEGKDVAKEAERVEKIDNAYRAANSAIETCHDPLINVKLDDFKVNLSDAEYTERDGMVDARRKIKITYNGEKELKNINKPFVMILNTTRPYAPETENLRQDLSMRYNVPVISVNCAQLKSEDINSIMEKLLYEFPLKEIKIKLPKWMETLDINHWLKQNIIGIIKNTFGEINKLRELKNCLSKIDANEIIKKSFVENVVLGQGSATMEITFDNNLFFKILSETTAMEIHDERQLISTIKILADAKKEYDKIKFALEEVKHKGYGIVTPVLDEMTLENPVIIKHGSKFGVKFKAKAPSIHLIRADIETEIAPIVGSQQQSEELISNLNNEMANDPNKIWELNMFGKSMYDLIKDGLQSKLYNIPEDAQMKLQETLQKIINEGNGGLICIIL